ncbi:MAG: GNAT family N-acetyltransferase [Pseudomonadota bacterium]|nr:GNAT family N-acetyltransferase [Pseudomonadota bacterium]
MIVIETPRLILRKFREDDLDDLCVLYADHDIRRYFPDGVLNRDQTKEELDWYLQGGFPGHPELGLWATIHRTSGRFIGRCGLIPWTIDDKLEIETAYLIARDFWRQGLGAEAAGALIRHGFTKLGLTRLIALIDTENIASIRTAEKTGFRFEREAVVEGTTAQLYSVSATEGRSIDSSRGQRA